jgi:hypothetical protein
MVINMRLLLIIFLCFFSAVTVAQTLPAPICAGQGNETFEYSTNLGIHQNQCVNGSTATNKRFFVSLGPGPEISGLSTTRFRCDSQCTCPAGSTWYQGINTQGIATSGCSPNDGGSGSNQCETGQVHYEGLCRDAVASPGDCGSTYSTAINVGGSYVCSNNGCASGQSQSIFSNAQGSWNVCGGEGDGSGSGSSGANTSGANTSNGGSNTSGSNTSSGSGTGTGDGDGGSPGTGGGSGGGDGSGTNTSGGANSSVAGGGGTLPTQSASSTSSAFGAASSGTGAGNCDPTSHDYLSCISRENPGNGDGTGDAFEPSGDKGVFDGEAAEKRRAELEGEIADQMETIKQEISDHMGGGVSGTGTLTDNCVTVKNEQVCFGMAKFSQYLGVIGQAIFLIACVYSFAIVVGRN